MDSYPGLLAQVLTNLTMNAIIHAFEGREGGRVQLAVEHANDWLTLMFTDNGRVSANNTWGASSAVLHHATRARRDGSGLHIVYNIVTQQLGAPCGPQSGRRGACFIFAFHALPRVSLMRVKTV